MEYKEVLTTRGFTMWDKCSTCPVGTLKETWGSHYAGTKGVIFLIYPNTGHFQINYYSVKKYEGLLNKIEEIINEKIVEIKTAA